MTSPLRTRLDAALTAARPISRGQVTGAVGLRVTVAGVSARVGDLLVVGQGSDTIYAEVAAIDGERLSCLPLGPIAGIGTGSPVVGTGAPLRITVGEGLRGRILDGLGRPMDGGPPRVLPQRERREASAMTHRATSRKAVSASYFEVQADQSTHLMHVVKQS